MGNQDQVLKPPFHANLGDRIENLLYFFVNQKVQIRLLEQGGPIEQFHGFFEKVEILLYQDDRMAFQICRIHQGQ